MRGKSDSAQFPSQRFDYALEILKHVIVPKSDNAISKRIKLLASRDITLIICMLPAVNFHDELRFETNKVGNKRPYGPLTAKLSAANLAIANGNPKPLFGIR